MAHNQYTITGGDGTTLDVFVREGTDMDGGFNAICNDTGENLYIRGWMIEEITPAEEIVQ